MYNFILITWHILKTEKGEKENKNTKTAKVPGIFSGDSTLPDPYSGTGAGAGDRPAKRISADRMCRSGICGACAGCRNSK